MWSLMLHTLLHNLCTGQGAIYSTLPAGKLMLLSYSQLYLFEIFSYLTATQLLWLSATLYHLFLIPLPSSHSKQKHQTKKKDASCISSVQKTRRSGHSSSCGSNMAVSCSHTPDAIQMSWRSTSTVSFNYQHHRLICCRLLVQSA